MAYDHKTIEKKWQKFWKKNETFKADLNKDQKKYYALDEFVNDQSPVHTTTGSLLTSSKTTISITIKYLTLILTTTVNDCKRVTKLLA